MSQLTQILLITISLLASVSVQAQEDAGPYYLSLKRELLYSGSGAVGTAAGFYLNQNLKPTTFGALERPNFLEIDELDIFDDDEDEDLDFEFAPQSAGQLSDLTLFALGYQPCSSVIKKRVTTLARLDYCTSKQC